ncbi:MFS transporter [Metamycoplasma auris]|uniref:MFS transporter n=1 Tax=Metamycoplasma auris TaxID=51363 RepID=UPI001B802DE5|nr:MFS transporter [Metamycoplasma auris]
MNTCLGIIHSFRFIYLKNVVYYIATNNKEMKTLNISNSFATSFGLLLSAILSFFLFKNLAFYWLVILNMVTYLISGFLYFSLQTTSSSTNFQTENDHSKQIIKKTKLKSWIFILCGTFLVGIFLYPKISGLSQLFSSLTSYKIDTWGFYLSIIFTLFSLLGVIVSYFLRSKEKYQKTFFIILIALMLILNFVWLPFKNTKESSYLISYIAITTTQQFLFSLFIPIFYSLSYELFDKHNFHKQNGISIVFRILLSSLINLILTLITIQFTYFYAYLFYSAVILIACLGIFYSMFDLRDLKIKKYYNNKLISDEYKETTTKGLWKSEKLILNDLITKKVKITSILDIGCGTGRTTFELEKIFPEAKIIAIDISKELMKNLKDTKNITFLMQNILTFKEDTKFDLIFFSFNGLTNIISKRDLDKFFKKINNLLRDKNSHFIFTIHDMFSSDEYKDFWTNKIKVYSLPLFSNKKVLINTRLGIKHINRFYTHEDMLKIFDIYSFKLNNHFKRNDDLEEDWVKDFSMPIIFYDVSKK